MTLTRLPDSPPEQWLPFPQVMRTADWYGYESFGWSYGNFWARLPCRTWPHRWVRLRKSDELFPADHERYRRWIARCSRCGSQTIAQHPPRRGTL